MAQTKEQKALYCREWRIKNRELYLARKRAYYQKNKDNYRDEAKARSSRYYYDIVVPKRKADPKLYKVLDRAHSVKRLEVRRKHLRQLREEGGGKCVDCGYAEKIDILQFHHEGKKIDNVTNIQNYKKREAEAKKCILLCPNCHAIRHLNNA